MYINFGSVKVFFIGVLVGIVIASVGLAGIGRIVDKGVDKVKVHSVKLAE